MNNETPVPHNLDEPRSSDFHNIFLPTAVHEALNYSNAETYASTLLHSRSVLPSLSSENQKHEEHHPENDGEINNEFLPTKEGLPDTFLASPPSILMGKEHSLDLAQFIQNEFSEPINHLTKRTSNFIDDLAYLRMQFSLHDLPVSLIWETSRETSRSFLSIFPYINATPAAQLTFNGLDILQPTMHQNWLYTSSFLVQRVKLKLQQMLAQGTMQHNLFGTHTTDAEIFRQYISEPSQKKNQNWSERSCENLFSDPWVCSNDLYIEMQALSQYSELNAVADDWLSQICLSYESRKIYDCSKLDIEFVNMSIVQDRLWYLAIHLTELYINLPLVHPARSITLTSERLVNFFSLTNFCTGASAYFHHFHQHLPMIHPAIFNPQTTSLPLVLAVFLIGSLYTSSIELSTTSRMLLDLAEEYIFQELGHVCSRSREKPLAKELFAGSQSTGLPDLDDFWSLQAATLIIWLQFFEGDEIAMSRIEYQKVALLISASRALSIFAITHAKWMGLSDWNVFLMRETCIRTAHFIFNLDCFFCALRRKPPHMVLSEMTTKLPCHNEVFEAYNCEMAAAALQAHPPVDLSLIEVIKIFLNEPNDIAELCGDSETATNSKYSSSTESPLMALTPLHLFLAVTGLISFISTTLSNCFGDHHLVQAGRALRTWQFQWDNCMQTLSTARKRNMGFYVTAGPEALWLGSLMVFLGEKLKESSQVVPNSTNYALSNCFDPNLLTNFVYAKGAHLLPNLVTAFGSL